MIDSNDREAMAGYIAAADRYFRELEEPRRLFAKPFVPLQTAGYNVARLGYLLHHLGHHPIHTVLDFGAGMCWLTIVLLQSGCRVIALDVSEVALALGAEAIDGAYPPPPGGGRPNVRLLPYDGFHIPLADGAIDRVACFDALHHVPNKRTVLRELYRVLRNGGRACFVEPGPGHASSQEAVEEARSWGVLEDEVDAPALCRLAKEVGFESSYIVPLPPLSDNALEPGAFQAIRESDRRGVLDWTGNDALIVLGKLPAGVKDSRSPGILAADLEVVNCPDVVDPGEIIVAELKVTNVGDTTWLALRPQATKRPLDYASAFLNKSVSPGDRSLGISVALYREYLDEHDLGGAVAIGAQLWPVAGLQAIDSDYGRGFFNEDVAPGGAVRATVRMRAPCNGGLYCLKFDAVAEYLTWFSATGSAAEHHYFTVRGDRPILDSRAPGRLSAHIRVVERTDRGKLVVSITNAGDTVWLANPLRSGGWVRLGVQAIDDEGAVTDRDWRRVRLPNDVVPGDSASLRLDLSDAPPSLNRARLDLVSELRCWFEEQEATPVTVVL